MPIATIIDSEALWQTVVAAFAAGLWVVLFFSIAVLSAARASDAGRDGRRTAATVLVVVSLACVAACVAAIAAGLVVMTAG